MVRWTVRLLAACCEAVLTGCGIACRNAQALCHSEIMLSRRSLWADFPKAVNVLFRLARMQDFYSSAPHVRFC